MSIFYDPNSPKDITRGDLPHWSQQGSLHFVTFRLADSLPVGEVVRLQAERESWQRCHQGVLTAAEHREYARLFYDRVEEWLDAGCGKCILSQPWFRQVVAGAMEFFAGTRYVLDHWVVMPNHVRVIIMPLGNHSLTDILRSWKSFTAHEINRKDARSGQVWQHESFDHIVRSESQPGRFRKYIIDNAASAPKHAKLATRTVTEWPKPPASE